MQKNRINTSIAILVLLLTGLATTASARPGPGDDGGRRGPPPEAIDACEGMKANDPCNFTGRHDDTIEGTCLAPPDGDQLACVPEGGPPERGHR